MQTLYKELYQEAFKGRDGGKAEASSKKVALYKRHLPFCSTKVHSSYFS